METKTIWKSKTFWTNVIAGAIEVTQLLTGTNWISPQVLALITAGLNIALRKITSQPVTFTKPK